MLVPTKNLLPTERTKLKCSDYGFECDFIAQGDIEQVIIEFGEHTDVEHGIDYSKQALMQFVLRKIEKLKRTDG
jgi:predicted small metal-binding protein